MSTLTKVKVAVTRNQKRKLERLHGPSSAETAQSKAMMETTADGHKKIIWYELSTNISKHATEIIVNYKKIKDGVEFCVAEVSNMYFDIQTDFLDKYARVQSENEIFSNIGKSNNDGSFYGTGTGAIADNTNDYQIHILNKKTKKYQTNIRKTGDVVDTDTIVDSDTINLWKNINAKVIHTFICKTNTRYTEDDLIAEFKKIISITEGVRIISDKLIVKFNDEVILPTLTLWETSDKNGYPIPEFTYIKDSKGNDIKTVSITHKDFYGKNKQIDFRITAVGKRKSGEKAILDILNISNEDSGDRPYMVIRLKDSKKIIGIIFLRNRGGDVNLNRVVVEAEVERNDIISFFARMSKGEQYVIGFEAAVGKEFRKQLEKFCYPAEETKEECKQEHLYQILVNDTYGPNEKGLDKNGADKHRDKLGISFLNKLTPKQRTSYVKKETKDGPNRYDIEVRVPKNTPIKITGFDRIFKEDVIILFENKKGNFKEAHIDQSSAYAASCMSCVAVYGVGLETSTEMEKNYKEAFDKMQKSKQFRLEYVGGELIDLNKDFFQYKAYEQDWRDYVNTKHELIASTKDEIDK